MNALFIHIPKTGGMSVARALDLQVHKLGLNNTIRPERISQTFKNEGMVTFRHALYKNLRKKGVISDEFDRTSFKFCFCRLPYDRVVSHWKHTMKKHLDRLPGKVSFLEFTRLLGTRDDWIPQHTWIDGVEIDLVGRFEQFDHSLLQVAKCLEMEIETIPLMNTTKHRHYSTYYCDESKQRVDDYYHKDFEIFGYKKEIINEPT